MSVLRIFKTKFSLLPFSLVLDDSTMLFTFVVKSSVGILVLIYSKNAEISTSCSLE